MLKFTKKAGEVSFQLETNVNEESIETLVESFVDEKTAIDLAVAKWIIVCQTAVGSAFDAAIKEGKEFTNEDAQAIVDKLEMKYRRGKKADPVAKTTKMLDELPPEIRDAILAKYNA